MKKFTAILISVLLVIAVFTGCSANSKSAADSGRQEAGFSATEEASSPEDYVADDAADVVEATGTALDVTKNTTDFSEKIIYSASVEIETTEFDKSVDSVYEMLDTYGAFIENSSISGVDYYSSYNNYRTYRSAYFTIRVPVESFEEMKGDMDELGNVLYLNTNEENITTQYTDTESRLKSYRIEEESLFEMLEKAETVDDMITIQSRLSEVRYNIESLTTTLKNWQNQVDYSTIDIQIREVENLSQKVELQLSYWEQMWNGVKNTVSDIGSFFKGLFKGFVIILPVIIILGIIAVAVVFIVKACVKKHKSKAAVKVISAGTVENKNDSRGTDFVKRDNETSENKKTDGEE